MWKFHFGRRRAPAPARPDWAALRAMTPARWQALLAADPAAARPWIEAAARNGLVEAQMLMGQRALDEADPPAAFAWFAAAAGAGHPPGLNMLGRCHENGWGTAPDAEAALALFRRAAAARDAWGQFNLGSALLRGQGTPPDRRLALVWFIRAARQGHAKAMNMVARYLEEGWDMPADRAAAARWYRAAAQAGDFRAQFNHATLLLQASDPEAAARWFETALASRNPDVTAATAALRTHAHPALRAIGERARAAIEDLRVARSRIDTATPGCNMV